MKIVMKLKESNGRVNFFVGSEPYKAVSEDRFNELFQHSNT